MVGPGEQHDHAESQLEQEQPADDPVNAVTLAQRQEVQVVQVRGHVRYPCGSRSSNKKHSKTYNNK